MIDSIHPIPAQHLVVGAVNFVLLHDHHLLRYVREVKHILWRKRSLNYHFLREVKDNGFKQVSTLVSKKPTRHVPLLLFNSVFNLVRSVLTKSSLKKTRQVGLKNQVGEGNGPIVPDLKRWMILVNCLLWHAHYQWMAYGVVWTLKQRRVSTRYLV